MFQETLTEIKTDIDAVFGEGYATANPYLVDRLLQQKFKATRTTRYFPQDSFSLVISDVLSEFKLQFGPIDFIPTAHLLSLAANKLGCEVSKSLEKKVTNFMSQHYTRTQQTVSTSGSKFRLRGYAL